MTIYTVQMPSGEVLDIEGPSGASERDLFNAGQQHLTARKQQAGQMALEGMSGTQKFLAGVGQGMTELGRGISQRLGRTTEAEVADARAIDQPLLNTGAGAAGSFTGKVAPALVASMVAPPTAASAALVGAGFGLAEPTIAGEDPLVNAAKGSLFNVGGHALGKALFSPVTNRNAQPRQDLIDLGKQKYGIDFPASTQTGSKPMAYLESQLAASPGGGRVADLLQRSNEQYAKAVMREAGAPGELATQASLKTAQKSTQNAYEQLWNRNIVTADNQFMNDLVAAETLALRTLTPEKVSVVKRQIDNILDKVQPNGTIDGKVYQMFLRPEIRGVAEGDSSLKIPLKQVQRALDAVAMRSLNAADVDAVSKLNYTYAVQKAIKDRVGPAEARGGTFTPSDIKVAAGDMHGNIGELARIGPLLREPPQSGTVPRAVMEAITRGSLPATAGGFYGYQEGGASGAAGGALMGLLAPAIASRALASPAAQRYLTHGMLGTGPQPTLQALLRAGAIPLPALINASQQ